MASSTGPHASSIFSGGGLHAQGPLALALIGGGALLMWAVLAGATFPWEVKTATDQQKDKSQTNTNTMQSPMGPLQSLALFGTASDLADLAGIVA